MSEEFLADLSADKLIRIVYRHRNEAAAFGVSMVLLVLIALFLIPKKFVSEGKMFVQLGRGGVTLDPTATTGQTIMVQEPREAEVNSVVDILKSRGLAEAVINHPEIGVDRVLETNFVLDGIVPSIPNPFGNSGAQTEYDQQSNLDLAVSKLLNSLSVSVPRNAANVTIWYTSESPEFSQLVVDTIMATYLEKHVRARQTEGSFVFFENQLAQKKQLVDTAAEELSEFKNKIGVMSISDRRSALRKRISEIEQMLINVGSQFAAHESRVKQARSLIEDTPENLVLETTEGVANHGSDLMRNQLYELELTERQLLTKYEPAHPRVMAVRAQVEQAQKILDSQFKDRTVTKQGLNQNLQSLKMNQLNSSVELAAIQSEKSVLEAKLETARLEMERLNQDEIKFTQLGRNLEINDANYRRYADKMEEARINVELDRKQISNVKIVQPASFQVKHISPRRGLIMGATLVFSFLASVGYALIRNYWCNTLDCEEDIHASLNMEVLGMIPKFTAANVSLSLPHRITHDPRNI